MWDLSALTLINCCLKVSTNLVVGVDTAIYEFFMYNVYTFLCIFVYKIINSIFSFTRFKKELRKLVY
ncbi:UNVERIFIED_CONTAM: hypothetical protein RMT77_004023 [Armadillidium vulgare]